MKIVAIDGSPTPEQSSITALVLRQFLDGSRSAGADVETVRLSEIRISPCDCGHRFICWVKTPGRCIHDDTDQVHEILTQMKEAEIIVFATPLYIESMTGQMKTFLDRTLPLVQPFIEVSDGECRHPLRSIKDGMRFVLVSVCGHYEISQFSALVHTFERIARNLHGKLVARILRPHAMLLRDPDRARREYDLVMNALYAAGRELALNGYVDKRLEEQVHMELVSRDSFVTVANQMWEESLNRQEFL